MGSDDIVERAVAALEVGELVVIPTDTVYGLAAIAQGLEPTRRLYRLKGRTEIQPTALVTASVELLFECIPELDGLPAAIVRSLLPGPFTLVVPNPAGRFSWLSRQQPGDDRCARAGAHRAHGGDRRPGRCDRRDEREPPGRPGPAPARRGARRDPCRASRSAIDGGELPGTPSTVDRPDRLEAPVVLRAGAGDVRGGARPTRSGPHTIFTATATSALTGEA